MAQHDVVVIGGSAGAVDVITRVVRGLPAEFPAAILVVVHFPPTGASVLPAILGRAGFLPASHASDGQVIRCGHIYVAPPDCHLLVDRGILRVVRGPRENGHRPAVDPLFRTAARAYGPRVVGVILSGNLDDGTLGLRRIKTAGGIAIVQDPADATYKGMPSSAIAHTPVDHVVTVDQLAPLLIRIAGTPAETPMRPLDPPSDSDPDIGDPRAAEHDPVLDTSPPKGGQPSAQTCPECHGALWELPDGELVYYRCRVGHSYTPETLLVHQADELDAALWTALRALEEHAALARRLAARATGRQLSRVSSSYTEQALDAEHHAAVIRRVVHRLHLPATDTGSHTDQAVSA